MKEYKEIKRWTNVGNLHIHPVPSYIEIYDRQDKFIERVRFRDLELMGDCYYHIFASGDLDSRTTHQVAFKLPATIILYEGNYICNRREV